MIQDFNLEFMRAGRDTAPVTNTRALPLGQGDLGAPTQSMGTYPELFIEISTPLDLSADMIITLQDSDTQNGTYNGVRAYQISATATPIPAGSTILRTVLPHNLRNWLRFNFSTSSLLNVAIVRDVEKPIPGMGFHYNPGSGA